MIELSQSTLDQGSAPSSAPGEPSIDLDHLRRMTLGDRGLQREVLELFDRQAGMLIARMREASPAAVSACAHTLKGSARGIGAFGVALAAEAVELAVSEDQLAASLGRLDASVAATKAIIAELLRAH
jgi:HPt (histidine-containing phosphotransfer) domain-containing protein